jgi:hypothetical protein
MTIRGALLTADKPDWGYANPAMGLHRPGILR